MSGERTTYYITTPIYYADSDLHIGHAYCTVAADALARFNRLRGRRTFFLTGTDEHGQKIEEKARSLGKEPLALVDEVVARILPLWERLGISYDDFIRTTEPRHEAVVQAVFKRLHDQGDIYKAQYEGWYCTPCETFWLERQLGPEGRCPDCEREVRLLKEESYFFRLSKYQDRLLEYIDRNPDFIQPPGRRNEMVSFVRQGLEDLCVTRTTFDWGVPVPFDPDHVVYVWIDALTNYISALGYLSDDPGKRELFETFWPADVHLVGKEIMRFHAVIWPILLMALGLPLPKRVYGHGWLVLDGGKMSKSKGNIIDPHLLMDKYGVDAVRYFLLREIPFGADGRYSEASLVERVNVDLANDLGNLLNRTLTMVEKYCGGVVPAPSPEADDRSLEGLLADVGPRVARAMDDLQIPPALETIWELVDLGNRYIEENAPWNLARDPAKRDRLDTVLYNLLEALRAVAQLLIPFLRETPGRIWAQLGLDGDPAEVRWDEITGWGRLPPGTRVAKGQPLFPRIDPEAALGRGEGE
ncbi:MAG: methionine--tRNA ligase [Bacillota bacterium]|jgi:methionyl-tRNA synthetase